MRPTLLLLGCVAALAPARVTVAAPVGTSVLTGTVTWSKPQPPILVHVARDGHVCGAAGPIYERDVGIDGQGRIREVLVYVETSTPATKPPPVKVGKSKPSVLFDQQNCTFVPHLAVARVGTKVRFRNSDAVLHNVHAFHESGESVANFALPFPEQEVEAFTATRPGRYQLRCDAGHGWMSAYLVVLPHSWSAVTDGAGHFRISGLPPGKHAVVAWHPDLGRAEQSVEVPPTSHPVEVRLVF